MTWAGISRARLATTAPSSPPPPSGGLASDGPATTTMKASVNKAFRSRGPGFTRWRIVITDLLPILLKVHIAPGLTPLVRLETALFQDFNHSRWLRVDQPAAGLVLRGHANHP